MIRRFALLGALVLVGLVPLSAAQASPQANVTFGLSAGTPTPTGRLCPLTVPVGANGLAVLDAAKAKGCIRSYATQQYAFGTFVSCIDDVCAAPEAALYATYWEMFKNGASTSYGVSDFRAANGDDLTFSYDTWLNCLVSC